MNIETDPNLPSVASKPYALPPNHYKWAWKLLENLENAQLFNVVIPYMLLQ